MNALRRAANKAYWMTPEMIDIYRDFPRDDEHMPVHQLIAHSDILSDELAEAREIIALITQEGLSIRHMARASEFLKRTEQKSKEVT
jgi:capsule polysaccharide export protein KpsC/LpsZ